jgi:hypothetical protein
VCTKAGDLLDLFFTTGNVHDSLVVSEITKDLEGLFVGDAGYLLKEDMFQELYERHRHIMSAPRENMKKAFETAPDLNAFLQRKKRETPPVPSKATGEPEARIIALACSKPPAGYAAWALRLLADTCVELPYVDSLSHMTVSRLLKKHNVNPM